MLSFVISSLLYWMFFLFKNFTVSTAISNCELEFDATFISFYFTTNTNKLKNILKTEQIYEVIK